MEWKEKIPQNEIEVKVTKASVDFAERFGKHLGTSDTFQDVKTGKVRSSENKLTTSQLRKFFGEVKRQQMEGYDPTRFILLKPKLAYAVGRAKEKKSKINDFYFVIADAIDRVRNEQQFKNFILVFEAIVAYHKAAEESKQ